MKIGAPSAAILFCLALMATPTPADVVCQNIGEMSQVKIRDMLVSPLSDRQEYCGGLIPVEIGLKAIAIADGDGSYLELWKYTAWSSLVDLGYALESTDDPTLHAAIRSFQGDAGYEPNGVLTFEQMRELTRRARLFSEQHVWIDSGLLYNDNAKHPRTDGIAVVKDDKLIAAGTWVVIDADQIEDDISWHPINTLRIECVRGAMTCVENMAFVTEPEPDSGTMKLNLIERSYKVVDWSDNALIAERPSPGIVANPACRCVLEIDLTSGTVRAHRNQDAKCTENGLVRFQPWVQSRSLQLTNSGSASADYWIGRKRTARSFITKELRQKLPPLSSIGGTQ
jgi:hypothetical protein